jgi:DNA-binding XRE family transcriptional regulator
MSRKFTELSAPIDADPQRRARVEAHKRAIYTSLHLAALRQTRDLTQTEIAMRMGVSQARVSQIEHGENLELETIIAYVAALGGRLSLDATFADTTVPLLESIA